MKIHFIGVGGIGVSALAKYYLEKNHKISGSDLVSSEIVNALKKSGAKIFIGKHKAENLSKDVDLVIYSPAVPLDNPEIKAAQKSGIKYQTYPQALGELTKQYFTIAVSGTHGKSTTTSMIGLLLEKAGFDPTVIVGTKLKEWGNSNCRIGKSRYLVIEADEWQASFLNYWPKIIVLTNIEEEHMDFFKDTDHILEVYTKYLNHLPKEGVLIANKDNQNVRKMAEKIPGSKYYSIEQKESQKLRNILQIPGQHNVSNALAALSVAQVLEIPDQISFESLKEYKGSWRRFEIKQLIINKKQITTISDYAHHPTEIKVTLKATREKYPDKKIWCVFQPHQYQRTYHLWDDFVKVFRNAPVDQLIITDIYDVAGREDKQIKNKTNSEKLIKQIDRSWALYLPKNQIMSYLEQNLKPENILIIMGAGDIYKIVS